MNGMIDEIRSLMNEYIEWLRAKNTLRQVDDWVEITTPYLDRHNDYLQIYVGKADSSYLLTDDGYIIQDLEICGCVLDTPKRISLLHDTLNGFGVRQNKVGALEVSASRNNFSQRKHNLVQAMLAVNDLFYLAAPTIANIFKSDVIAWLNQNEIRYTPDVTFKGKTGFDHRFDFVIPGAREAPERILQTINQPGKNTSSNLAFAWIDTKDIRPLKSKAYGLINDVGDVGSTVEALEKYDVKAILWSERQDILPELKA
jgi:hypothetical protein